MKINTLFYLSFAILLALAFNACKKQETFNTEIPQVIKLVIEGSTTNNLEFVFKDSIVASATGSFRREILLNTAGINSPELYIREEGATEIISARPLNLTTFNQSMFVYYDNGNLYERLVRYTIKGYAQSGELEFLLDGNPILTGTLAINKTISILLKENEQRQLEVRKSGETTVFITDEIEPDVAEQSMVFFFDGTEVVDGIEIAPPQNPENMAVTAQFKTKYTDPNSTSLYFIGGNEVDLVFYTRQKGYENQVRTTPENKVDPEIRITIPTDGTFVNFELPPLADPNMEYSFDIVEKETENIPYIKGTKASSSVPDVRANQGRYGSGIIFEQGLSKLLLIGDNNKSESNPTPRARLPIPAITDLSQYFQ